MNAIVPHAPYSVSPALLQLIASFPGNRFLSLHNQESEAETAFLKDGTGDMRRLYEFSGHRYFFLPAFRTEQPATDAATVQQSTAADPGA